MTTTSEVKEAWGSPGVENPSFNTVDIPMTPIHSFIDDLGYQGSQDLTSMKKWRQRLEVPYVMGCVSGEHASFLALGFFKEEDPSLVPGKRLKRNKIAILRMRRNKMREEDENDKDDEEDKAGRSPRVRRKQQAYSKTCQLKQKENLVVLESNLNTTASNKSSPWSMMEFWRYLCTCCLTKQKSVEENKASDSKERNPDEKNGVTGSINEQERQQAPEGTPGGVPGKTQENRECNPSTCK